MEIIRPLVPARAVESHAWSGNGRQGAPHLDEGGELPDKELLEQLMLRVKEGSTRGLQRLMDELWPGLVRFAARELCDRELAEDVVQEAFIYLWRHRSE